MRRFARCSSWSRPTRRPLHGTANLNRDGRPQEAARSRANTLASEGIVLSNMRSHRGRLSLAVAPQPSREEHQSVWFCSHCGTQPPGYEPGEQARVCPDCGLGVLLEAGSDVAPPNGGAFMVFDRSLSVCALSAGAERLLAARETEAVNQTHHRAARPRRRGGAGAGEPRRGSDLGRGGRRDAAHSHGPPREHIRGPPHRADRQLQPTPGRAARVRRAFALSHFTCRHAAAG